MGDDKRQEIGRQSTLPAGGDSMDRVLQGAARVDDMPLPPRRAGNYTIGERIGGGGMGEVFVAEHEVLGHRAIKIIRWPAGSGGDTQADLLELRFKKEARALDQLRHPNVVQVHDFGRLEDGRLYYVMELLEGQPLRSLLGRDLLGDEGGARIAVPEVLGYLEQLCAGLQAAHERQIIHRDLKPENIIVGTDGALKIVDFGIAKLIADTLQPTTENQSLGTLLYMAPEQMEPGGAVGPHNDIYSLGVVLYRMLSGRLPYRLPATATPMAVLGIVATQPRIPLSEAAPELPAGLGAVVDRCLASDTGGRPASAREVVETCAAAVGPSSRSPPRVDGDPVGRKIGNYVVERELGRGGFGAVYRARHPEMGREVAIKVLNVGLTADASRRFVDEARAATQIRHRNVIEIYDMGTTDEGWPYCVMELLEGRELSDVFREAIADRGRMEPTELRPYLEQICTGLQAAHERGIVHRDLKPDNIFVVDPREDEEGLHLKILDFGIAKLLHRDDPADKTATGVLMGTPHFLAPEQATGQVSTISPRTDVYSLGVILYQALSGKLPFTGDSALQVASQHITARPRPIAEVTPGLPPAIAQLVMQCLAKAPEGRPASVRDVAQRFTAAIAPGDPGIPQTVARSPAVVAAPTRSAGRGLHVALAALGGIALVASAYFILTLRNGDGDEQRPVDRQQPASKPKAGKLPARNKPPPPPAPRGMARIAGGTFRMGSTPDEIEAAVALVNKHPGPNATPRALFEREQPAREVKVTSFYIHRHEVTHAAFAAWLADRRVEVRGDCALSSAHRQVRQACVTLDGRALVAVHREGQQIEPRPGLVARDGEVSVRGGRADRPLTHVTWHGADRYCRDNGWALPSEAEWEYAARGAARRLYPWGDAEPRCDGVIFARGRRPCPATKRGSWKVGTAAQDVTPEGVHDLAGNVTEWVADLFARRHDVPSKGPERVLRGGHWGGRPESLRAAGRSRMHPGDAMGDVGFRCVKRISR